MIFPFRFRPMLTCICLACLQVASADEAPVAIDRTYDVLEGSTKDILIRLEATDADAQGINHWGYTRTIITGPSQGSLSPYPDYENYRWYTPRADFSGTDTFTFRVTDDTGLVSNVGTITVVGEANQTPETRSQFVQVLSNRDNRILLWAYDEEDSTDLEFRVTSAPEHGEITYSNYSRLTYRPEDGFTGTDSFSYQVSDGNTWSPEATVEIKVRHVQDRDGIAVALLAPRDLYEQLKLEIDRLMDDMKHEGFHPVLRTYTQPKNKEEVWAELNELYDILGAAGHPLVGATIFGGFDQLDEPVNKLFRPDSGVLRMDLYVTRLGLIVHGNKNVDMDQVVAIRSNLDQNHAYRTGQLRLPWHALKADWEDSLITTSNPQAAPSDHEWRSVWDRSSFDSTDTSLTDDDVLIWNSANNGSNIKKAFNIGGQYMTCLSHGARGETTDFVTAVPVHVFTRFACFAGGIVRYYAYGRSGNLIASAANAPDEASVERMMEGDFWGNGAINGASGGETNGGFPDNIHGDLSLPLIQTPHNDIPELSFNSVGGIPGQTLMVEATVLDDTLDDNPHKSWKHSFEWYPHPSSWSSSRNQELYPQDAVKIATDQEDGNQFSVTINKPYNRTYVVRVEDEWGASSYKSVLVVGKPNPNSPFRIASGNTTELTDEEGNTWWRDFGGSSNGIHKRWGHQGKIDDHRTSDSPIGGTNLPELYQNQMVCRENQLKWNLPLKNGEWTVRFHLAQIDPGVEVGEELVDLEVEGQSVATAFDVLAQAGRNQAHVISHTFTLTDGLVNLSFIKNTGSSSRPALAGIELIPSDPDLDYKTWRTQAFASHPQGSEGEHTEAEYRSPVTGLTNLEAFALKAPLHELIEHPLSMEWVPENGRIKLRFPRRTDISGVVYEIIATNDLQEPWEVVAQGLATVPMQLLKTGEFLLEEQQDGDLMQVQFEDVELPDSVLHRFMGLRLRQVP